MTQLGITQSSRSAAGHLKRGNEVGLSGRKDCSVQVLKFFFFLSALELFFLAYDAAGRSTGRTRLHPTQLLGTTRAWVRPRELAPLQVLEHRPGILRRLLL
jgi:hypothetical protein